MKALLLIITTILSATFSIGQEFTSVDTVAVRKNKVKTAKIYYTGTGTQHYLTHEFRYDKYGRCTYSSEGNNSYYYDFNYNEKSQVISSFQRTNKGAIIQGYLKDYYPTGEMFHVQVLNERDSIHPSIIYTYDKLENKVEESYFTNGKMTRCFKFQYDNNKQIVHHIDSTIGKSVYEKDHSKTIRQTYYNGSNEVLENWIISYDEKNRLIQTICYKDGKTLTYNVIYENETDYHVRLNKLPLSKEENVNWDSKFRWLMPRPIDEESRFGLPYSDPVSILDPKHELKRDKKGNIIQDKIIGGSPSGSKDSVVFEYEYEYW